MERKLVNSQLNNLKTYEMYKRQFLTLAENVFEYENLPEYIDVSYMNKVLVRQGSIAFFYDDVLEDERYVEHRFVLEEVIPILSKFSAFIVIFFGFGDVCILMYLI